jgi:hypothetical protein
MPRCGPPGQARDVGQRGGFVGRLSSQSAQRSMVPIWRSPADARDTGSTCPDFVLIRCLDDGQGLLAVTGWAAEDDEAIAGDRPGNQRQKCHTRLWSTGSTSRSGDS